jgi:hypothetical protein
MSDRLKKIFNDDEHDLLKVNPRSKSITSDDRLANAFLEINDFYVEHGHIPMVDTTDINERKLGVRLRALILDDIKAEALAAIDTHGLLKTATPPESLNEIFTGDQFGLLDDPTGVLTIRNVPTNIKKAENIARAHKSKDFAKYEQGFKDIHAGLKSGEWLRTNINSEYQIQANRYFVFNGVLAFVENRDDSFRVNGKVNARLHVIYENGTESNILLRSFARTLYRAKEGARIVPADYQTNPEWQDATDEDRVTGRIYILKSLSKEPRVQDIQNLYKIGYTTGEIEDRIRNAQTDPTYLTAPVEIVASYKCLNMNTQKLEHLIHRFFGEVKLDMSLASPDGKNYVPSEWYVVPLDVLDRVINLIINGEIVNYRYDSGLRDIVLTED